MIENMRKLLAVVALTGVLCGCTGGEAAETENEPAAVTGIVISSELITPKEKEPVRVTGSIAASKLFSFDGADSLYSEGVYLVELNTDTVLFTKNPDERYIPASLTKIMTAIVCLENVPDLDTEVECPESCFKEFDGEEDPNFDNASDAGIEPNQRGLTYRDCLYGLMLPSGCEAGNVIAYNVCNGDRAAFVDMMNDTVRKIGCGNTHFTNAHGLYETENYSTARDVCMITRYAIENCPEFLEISGAVEHIMPPNSKHPDGYIVKHTNRMCRPDSDYYYSGVRGIKTGSINEYFTLNEATGEWEKVETRGVRGIVSICEKNGYRFLLSTIAAPFYNEDCTASEAKYPYLDHKALYDWASENFEEKTVVAKGDVIASLSVEGGDVRTVDVLADEEFSMLLPKSVDENSVISISLPDDYELYAPIKKGENIGSLTIDIDSKNRVTIPISAAESIVPTEDVAA